MAYANEYYGSATVEKQEEILAAIAALPTAEEIREEMDVNSVQLQEILDDIARIDGGGGGGQGDCDTDFF